jgi:hypothetical protein
MVFIATISRRSVPLGIKGGADLLCCEQPKISPDPGLQALQDRVQLLGIGDRENEIGDRGE